MLKRREEVPLEALANTLVSLCLQLMKATVQAESFLFFIFPPGFLRSSDVYSILLLTYYIILPFQVFLTVLFKQSMRRIISLIPLLFKKRHSLSKTIIQFDEFFKSNLTQLALIVNFKGIKMYIARINISREKCQELNPGPLVLQTSMQTTLQSKFRYQDSFKISLLKCLVRFQALWLSINMNNASYEHYVISKFYHHCFNYLETPSSF